MGQAETRHTEKAIYFQILKAAYENNFAAAISSARASMDKEDIADVDKEFEEYKRRIEQERQ
jgi:hypothetical protein